MYDPQMIYMDVTYMFSPVFSLTDISHLILILSHGLGHTTSTPSFVKKQYITLKKLL